jgi:hypothetical protein
MQAGGIETERVGRGEGVQTEGIETERVGRGADRGN